MKLLILWFSIVLTVTPCFAGVEVADYISGKDKDNYVLLREHIDRIMAEKDKYYELCFRQAQEALILSKRELDRRLEELNELRKSVEKDRSQFVKADTFTMKAEASDLLIAGIDKRIVVIETRAITWTAALGTFFLVMQVALWIWFQKRNGRKS